MDIQVEEGQTSVNFSEDDLSNLEELNQAMKKFRLNMTSE